MSLTAAAVTRLTRRLGALGLGLVLVAVGVGLMIRAEVGAAPYDVLSTGLAARAGVDIGIAAMILPLAFTLVGWLLGGQVGGRHRRGGRAPRSG